MMSVEHRGGGAPNGEPTPSEAKRPEKNQPMLELGEGRGGVPPPGERQSELAQVQPPGESKALEAGKDYSAALSSIRADQDRETFVADLRQHAEPLLTLARELKASIRNDPTSEALRDKAALGIYLEVAIKQFILDNKYFSTNPDNYRDENSDEPLTEAERREMVAFWATERVALNWIDVHPDSETANEVVGWNIFGFPDQHQRLLQEMWPEILPQITS